ncbi:chemotaxis protein CheC [Haloarculaceae archaeon H-GB1-1]|nr:chemotaxis protein CheC [Haloarculaceae archaeon H-GB1-1]
MSLEVDVRKLALLNRTAKKGGDTVASHLHQLTGLDAEMEITKINFLEVPDVRTHVGNEKQIGISLELVDPPHGHLLILFDSKGARELAGAMLGEMADPAAADGGFSDMERSAIREIGNIMTSGFIDGWAEVLEEKIDISTPNFMYGPGSGMVDDLLADLDTDLALLFDSEVHVPESNVSVRLYLFPDPVEFVQLVQNTDI